MKILQVSAKKQKLPKTNRNYRTEKYIKKCKNLLDGLNNRMEMTDDRINDLKDRSIQFTQCEQQKENNTEKS